jgi:hypothetical protein
MKTRVSPALRRAGVLVLLLASAVGATAPFTLRFGAAGDMVIDMDPGSELLAYQLGYRTDALPGYDAYDVPKPSITPPGGGVPILYFPADPPYYGFSQDFRPPAASQAWQMNLIGMAPGTSVTLSWRLQPGSDLAGNALSLVDQASGTVLVANMVSTTSYALSDSDRTLLVLYGPANYPPVAHGDEFAMLQSDGSLTIPFASLLANDYDPDPADTIDVVGVGDPFVTGREGKGASAYGTTSIDTLARTVTYAPPATLPPDWDGVVYFDYVVRDNAPAGAHEVSATVQVTVAPHLLAVPVPQQVAVHQGTPFTAAYTLVYSGAVGSLSLSFTLPTAGSGPGMVFWPYGGSYSDNSATPDPTVDDGAGTDGLWGTEDDTGVVVLDFGTNVPPPNTVFSFVINVPTNADDAAVPSLAHYKVTGAEPEPLQQVLPNLAVKVAYTVNFSSAGNGVVQGEVTQLIVPGQASTAVTAVAGTGYHFLRWTRDGAEVSRANPLVVTGGTADMTIVAEFEINTYAVTFTATGNGTLDGTPSQEVAHGGNASPVTAVPGAGSYFNRWVRGGATYSTANPVIVGPVTEDMAVEAEFLQLVDGDPQGDFELVYRDPANPGLRKIWDLTGHYAGAVGPHNLTLDLVHDEKGALTGTGRFQGTVNGQPFDVANLPIKGSGKGKAGVVTVKASTKGTGGTSTVSLKLALTLDAGALTLTGVVSGSVSDTVAGKVAVNVPGVVLALPVGMDGSYRLPVHLILDAKGGVTGTGNLTLVNGRTVALLAKGKRAGAVTSLQLAGDKLANAAFGAIKMKLTIRTYANGTADIQAMAGKAFGQSLKWPF